MIKRAGFNLVELIVAMALGSLLGLALISIYSSVKRVEKIHQAWLQIIDNGRYAVFVLRRDVKDPSYLFFVEPTPYKNARGLVIQGLYKRQAEGDRELVALDIDKITINKNASNKNDIRLWLSSEDQTIKRAWSFDA